MKFPLVLHALEFEMRLKRKSTIPVPQRRKVNGRHIMWMKTDLRKQARLLISGYFQLLGEKKLVSVFRSTNKTKITGRPAENS